MTDRQNSRARQLQLDWERAAERAAQDKHTNMEMDQDELQAAAGLHVQSGVQAGGWTGRTCTCYCQ